MNANLNFQFLPVTDEDSKIEIQVDENEQVTLKLSTWTENLGWCSQKTMSFDAAMLENLQHTLTAARRKVESRRAESGQKPTSAKILLFPVAA